MPLTSINIYTLKQIRTKRHRYDLEDYSITSPLTCYKVLQFLLDLKSELVEKFGIISLNTRNKIVGIHIIGTGPLDQLYIEPRDSSCFKKWCQKFELRRVKFENKTRKTFDCLTYWVEFWLLNIQTSNFTLQTSSDP
jgi:hypothetical protein